MKELVENAIDAGAKNITIEIDNGGTSLIRVTDDGKGIKQADVELAFERHATSKIRSAKDLEEVSTMGFRGEALASIAAISKINVITKTADEEMGTKLQLEAGDIIKNEPIGASVGTSITIEELFFNTPVRHKFLKKEYTEAGYIEEVVRKLAIINKEIAFKLINNGKTILQTTGNSETKLVVYSIFGEEIANSIIETDYEIEDIKIFAIVGKPEIARSNRKNQLFFVNGRYIKDNTLTAATTKAFKGLIPTGRFGFCILDIRINPKLIDVNVHPTKEEIRFRDEQAIFKAVNTVIHNALAKSELVENIFVPKYDDKNFTHFNNYTVPIETLEGVGDEKNVDEVLHQPEENMIQTKKKAGFFNFKEKKSDKDIEEEELEKKHSEIYETLMKNPKFSYQEMLKSKEEEDKNKPEEQGDEDPLKLDWIGEEQTTAKLSKIQEKIKKSSSMSIHTILNRYKEQLDEEEAELEEKIKEGIKEETEETVATEEVSEEKEVIEEEKLDEPEILEEKLEEKELLKTEELEEEAETELVSEETGEVEEEIKDEDTEEAESENISDEDLEDKKRLAEEKYRALFESYKAGDYLKEEKVEDTDVDAEVKTDIVEEEIVEKEIETVEEEQLEDTEEPEEPKESEIIEEASEEKEVIEEEKPEENDILEKIQETIAKEAVTTTPPLRPLAQDDGEEHKDHFSEEIKEAVQTQASETENIISDFTSAEDENFVDKIEEESENIPIKLKEKFGATTPTTDAEAENILKNLIAQKVEKGEVTGVLDLDSINKILEQELQEKAELESLQQDGIKKKFDFAKMYKSAFGVASYEEQKQEKAFEESINVAQSFKVPELTLFNETTIPHYSVIGVAFGTYIIIEMKDSIYMIDQHATHERLLYEEVKFNYYNDQYKDSQTLLLPDVITLSYREMEIVRKNIEIFHKSGFELEEFGINTIKLISVPSMTEILNTKELFLDILDELDSAYVTGKDEVEEKFLSTIACKAAVKANMVLDEKEIRALLDDLFQLQNPFTCPHGRPTAIKMTKSDLERKFARK